MTIPTINSKSHRVHDTIKYNINTEEKQVLDSIEQ